MKWMIGCSGFSYKNWKEKFYPEKLAQHKWFEFYTEHFNTLELNVTFYRFPQLKTLQNWYSKSPGDFLFSVKVPRLITHYKKFNDCENLLSDFYGTIRAGLQQKLGAVLFQLPAQIKYDEGFLQKMIDSISLSFTNIIEFRHKSWWREDVYELLSKKKISFCSINYPGLPKDVVINTPVVYYRFHGNPKLYYSQYHKQTLIEMTDEILRNQKIKKVYVYFNNTATMAAINNANKLKAYIEKAE